MAEKIHALELNKTWTIEQLPSGKRPIYCKWVFKLKLRADGSVECYKARLVAKGFHQVEEIDFHETFAPVAKLGGNVCRLRKSLYGLRQTSRNWFLKFVDALRQYGFTQSSANHSLFTFNRGNIFLAVLVYVDDLIIVGNSSSHCDSFKGYLDECFRIKDLGPLKYFLGIEVTRLSFGLFLSQRKYVLDILTECGMLASQPSPLPMEQRHRLSTSSNDLLLDPGKYRCLIGRLIYLTITRLEISYSLHIVTQFMQEHRQARLSESPFYLESVEGRGIVNHIIEL
ncbi:hypothetical protein CRG98_022498 [Punica granatum]|uniref:Reverse transcriptase Ty1/copia-type domain-containing protein n=1 Tax=Punica granatum TaxID=22663 RepID=A0A2I0JLE6_PUNGR|nr:hypothetical protein CRG98_022498 [Punica granatum]